MTTLYDNSGRWHPDLLEDARKRGVPPNMHPEVMALPVAPAPVGQDIAYKCRPEYLAMKAAEKAAEEKAEQERKDALIQEQLNLQKLEEEKQRAIDAQLEEERKQEALKIAAASAGVKESDLPPVTGQG